MTTILTSILLVTCLIGCDAAPPELAAGDIPSNTQLALSPNGKRLLVSWNGASEKLRAKLVELDGNKVASVRELKLPKNTYHMTFAKNNEQFLVTTLVNKASELYKYNVNDGKQTLIYKSTNELLLPLEVEEENYVFLEGQDTNNKSIQWQRLQHHQKTVLHPKNYRGLLRLDVIDGALFTLEPWSPPAFRSLYGELPIGLSALVDNTTFLITCADSKSLVCLRSHLLYEKEVINYQGKIQEINGASYSTKEILNGKNRCEIKGRWIDSRENKISRDGSTVVFHAAKGVYSGPRSIYIVKNINSICIVNSISIMEG